MDYKFFCKIHSKKFLHRHDGEKWRKDLIYGLTGSSEIENRNLTRLKENLKIDIIELKGSILNI